MLSVIEVDIVVNEMTHRLELESSVTLLDALRERSRRVSSVAP